MYFPYFRGKQYELVLLKEQANQILKNRNIVPIIEPVKKNLNPLQRTLEQFEKNSVPHVLVANPGVGDFSNNGNSELKEFLLSETNKDLATIGIVVNTSSTLEEIQKLLDTFKDYKIAIIHRGFLDTRGLHDLLEQEQNSPMIHYIIFVSNGNVNRYKRKFKNIGKVIVLRDGFKREVGAKYKNEELFSDLHLDFIDEKLDGFGDFLIVGDDYFDSGGPAWTVVIHMTYLKKSEDNEMFIKHYKSDRRDDKKDAGGKFIEALKYLAEDENRHHLYNTKASQEYIELYEKKLFRGLGYAKKLSMQNHLEIIAKFLEEQYG